MRKFPVPIYVTKPNLPPLRKFRPYLKKMWRSRILSNNGPFHQLFEKELTRFLGVEHACLFNNATLSLIVALRALRISGEVITTPFSFVATTHAIKWNNLKPVFCDIDERTLCINADKIEQLVTSATRAIMPVHVYGHPCDVERIRALADAYGLKVIYDAAHAFNVKVNGETVLKHGDISVLSFHATKLFTTFEGGAAITRNEEIKKKIDILKNFGFSNEITIEDLGINAKMTEFQAALGLLEIKIVEKEIAKRKKVANYYRNRLRNVPGIKVFDDSAHIEHNYSYFPILVDAAAFGISRDALYKKLLNYNVYSRRYFYPLISNMEPYKDLPTSSKQNLPVANQVADQVLCLPIYGKIKLSEVENICQIIEKQSK